MQISFSSLKDIDHYETTSVSEKLAAAAAAAPAGVNVADPRSERGSVEMRLVAFEVSSQTDGAQVAQVYFGSTVHS